MPTRPLALAALLTAALAPLAALRADDGRDHLRVGVQPDGSVVVPTNQVLRPAGKQVTFPGRPVDLAFVGGDTLVVKNLRDLVFLDTKAGRAIQTLALPKSVKGFGVVGLAVQGRRVYASDSQSHVRVAERQEDGTYRWAAPFEVGKPKVGKLPHPAGLALGHRGLWVTSTRGNSAQLLDPAAGRVEQVVSVG